VRRSLTPRQPFSAGLIVETMEDELLAACRELLQQGLPSAVPRELDDEHRFIPLGVDINGDVAATAFIRRLPRGAMAGRPGMENSIFQQRDGNWVYLGGGAGHFEDYPLAERFPAAGQGSYLRAVGYGQTYLKEPRRFPWGARYAFDAVLRVSAEVCRLQVGGRVLNVPFHGHAVLIWPGRRGPAVIALASDGTRQASLGLSRDPLEVRHRRVPPR
jgi:hypothetical protein